MLKWKMVLVFALVLSGCEQKQATRENESLKTEQTLSLNIPLRCPTNETCWTVNTYPDNEPGPGLQDFNCGKKVQDNSFDTRFRLNSDIRYQSIVFVVAPAAGEVVARREGMDESLYEKYGKEAVEGKECGNGVMISHAEGVKSQVCHLRTGSVKPNVGDHVEKGQLLGVVGQSGWASEPFLSFVVRYNGEKIDPFVGKGKMSKYGLGKQHLWSEHALLEFGF